MRIIQSNTISSSERCGCWCGCACALYGCSPLRIHALDCAAISFLQDKGVRPSEEASECRRCHHVLRASILLKTKHNLIGTAQCCKLLFVPVSHPCKVFLHAYVSGVRTSRRSMCVRLFLLMLCMLVSYIMCAYVSKSVCCTGPIITCIRHSIIIILLLSFKRMKL